jgi:tetratricopeptide (TPR) repeat protein
MPSGSRAFAGMTTTPTPGSPGDITEVKQNRQRRGKALPALLALCAVLVVALPLSRKLLFSKPSPPPATATVETRRRYWKERIRHDVADRDAYVQLGILEERASFYIAARRNLEAARTLGAPDEQVSGPLGRALTQLSFTEQAEVELQKAVRLAPDFLEATLNLAGFFVNARQSAQARTLLGEFWKRRQNALTPLEQERFSLAALEAGELRLAREAAIQTLKRDPTSKSAAMAAARCSFALDEPAEARRYVEQALQGTETENAPGAQYFYGLVLRRLGDHDGALKTWQKANAADPTLMDAYERIGEEYARRKDYKRAAFAMERIALTSSDPGAILKTATAYRNSGQPLHAAYWEAVGAGLQGDYSKALALGKQVAASSDPIVRRRGQSAIVEAYRGMGKKAEVRQAVEQMTAKRTPDDLVYLAKTYEAINDYEKYIACLKELIQKDPSREAAMRFELAATLSKTGRREEAEQELNRVVELDPKNADALLELATLYLKTSSISDHLTRATRLAKESVAQAPTEEEPWRTLGQCYATAGQLSAAAYCLEHAIDLEAGRGPTYLELSRVYARSGNTAASQEMMKLYQKYVVFEQERSAIELRARREKATAAELTAYADLQLNLGNSSEAIRGYEHALRLEPKNAALRTTLTQLYQRFNLPERLALLRGGTK